MTGATARPWRRRTKAEWRVIGRRLGFASYGLCLWGLWFPRPYVAVMVSLVATPLIALVLARVSGGLLKPFTEQKRETTIDLFVILPPLIAAMRAMIDFPLIDGRRLLVIGAVVGILSAFAYLRLRPKRANERSATRMELICGFIAAIVYGWIFAAMLNRFLPEKPVQRFAVPVLEKYVSRGKGPNLYVTLPPFGPASEEGAWLVDRTLYRRTAVGDRVCVDVHPGALGKAWYAIASCGGPD